jgi:hypothetical protein
MKIEYRAYREIEDGIDKKVIEYAKDELKYRILTDNGLDKELLKQVDELLAYFIPKLNYCENMLSTRTKRYIASFLGKKDFILLGIRAYTDIVTILNYKKKIILHRIDHKNKVSISGDNYTCT